MPLHPGTRLGPYEIVNPLGAGGMGEVYRARDTRLNRDVAIKVLPAIFSSDPERLARFAREAQTLASVNHPNIAHVHGLEEGSLGPGHVTPALVMELVEGPTLADRIAQGRVPLEEALPVARQIADALEAAHERGIVHRDLKPANVKLRPDGTVKVLDFGLAKLIAPDGVSADAVMNSPTFTAPSTQLGVILGTAAYMAPEQAKGKPVDKRADIWAFGVILFEMLSGRRLFDGEAISEVLASVLKEEPRWTHLPPDTPESIRRLLGRCLEKDPKRRLHDIGDARIELDDAAHEKSGGTVRRGFGVGAVVAAAILGAAVMGTGWAWWARSGPANPEQQVRRLAVLAPPGEELVRDSAEHALSPDGRMIVFTAGTASVGSRLWLRSLDTTAPRPLPGTEGARLPFWSPDGRQIGYFAHGKLMTVTLDNLAITALCDAPDGRGASWSRTGTIVFAPSNAGALMRVSANGGEPRPVTTLDASKGETGHRFPSFLPDGHHFLFVSLPAREGRFDIYAASVDASDRKLMLSSGSAPVYAPSGHLIFTRNRVLVAQPFDSARLEPTGDPITLGDNVGAIGAEYSGSRAASAAANGSLSYLSTQVTNTKIVWMEPGTARETGTIQVPAGMYTSLRISPDGRRAFAVRSLGTDSQLWLIDLERGAATPITSGPGSKEYPEWSPDSSRIAFSSDRGGPRDIFVVSAAGNAPEELLYKSPALFKEVSSWSADGRYIVFAQLDPETRRDLWVLPLDGDRKPRLYLRTRADEFGGSISPDGRWMAYRSDETGRPEIYVQSFPTPGQKYAITTAGAEGGQWFSGGRQYVYGAEGKGFVVDVDSGPPFRVGPPRLIGTLPKETVAATATPDLKRILASIPVGDSAPGSLTVILDWTASLRRN